MAYFPVEDFVGNGALKGILPKLLGEGWDNVRNLKLMKSEDMDAINMTQQQKDALEMRSYLHDRALMQYGDKLEDSGKSLAKLLELSNDDLSAQFGMKRGHIASFLEKKRLCLEYYSIGGARNIVSQDEESPPEITEYESRGARVKEENKAWNKNPKEIGDTNILVATLITTITFAAGCTMPGGYNSNKGSNEGMPLLLREAAFKVFVITNTIAMMCSTSSVFLYVTASIYYFNQNDNVDTRHKRYNVALLLVLVAIAAMIVAFITGSYAVLAQSLGLAIFVCVVGCISLVIYFYELINIGCPLRTFSFIRDVCKEWINYVV